jgi:hypothetical protein
MWRALLIEGLPSSPLTMASDSVAMSCLVTSLAIFLPSLGLTKRSRWLATFAPALDPWPQLAVCLAHRGLHPLDPLRDDLIDDLALLGLLHFPVTECFGKRHSAPAPQPVDLAAGSLDGEGLGVVDAQPAGALLAGRRVGELEGEGRHASGGDADVEAGALAVVDFDPLGDALLAHAVGEDEAAIATAFACGFGGCDSIHGGVGSVGVGTTGSALRLSVLGGSREV